jgi:hypothetical protein
MVGALLVLVGTFSFLWGGLAWLVEPGETSLLLVTGIALTVAGGVVLLLSGARRLA